MVSVLPSLEHDVPPVGALLALDPDAAVSYDPQEPQKLKGFMGAGAFLHRQPLIHPDYT